MHQQSFLFNSFISFHFGEAKMIIAFHLAVSHICICVFISNEFLINEKSKRIRKLICLRANKQTNKNKMSQIKRKTFQHFCYGFIAMRQFVCSHAARDEEECSACKSEEIHIKSLTNTYTLTSTHNQIVVATFTINSMPTTTQTEAGWKNQRTIIST